MTNFAFESNSRLARPFSGASYAVSEPVASQTSPPAAGNAERGPRRPRSNGPATGPDRQWGELALVPTNAVPICNFLRGSRGLACLGPAQHASRPGPSFWSPTISASSMSFCLGIPLRRPLNFVARSTLFVPVLGFLIRSVGAFPIQREGMGVSGMKETLRRLRSGGIVTLFPEGTRSRDGKLAPLKSGIAVLVSRAGVPVVPAGIAGTFEAWPRSRLFPSPQPVRIHYGQPIRPEEIAGMDSQAITALISDRLQDCVRLAQKRLARDLNR